MSNMRADVFQAVALCCHAKSYLSGATDEPAELLDHALFRLAHEFRFDRSAANPRIGSGMIADAVGPWLRRLRKEGVDHLGISLKNCPIHPVQNATEPWGLLSDGDVGLELWNPSWKRRLSSPSDPSPWRVAYSAQRAGRWVAPVPPFGVDAAELEALEQELAPRVARQEPVEAEILDSLFPGGWPEHQVKLGRIAARICLVLLERIPPRDEARRREVWKMAMSALEAAVNEQEAQAGLPRATDFRRAG